MKYLSHPNRDLLSQVHFNSFTTQFFNQKNENKAIGKMGGKMGASYEQCMHEDGAVHLLSPSNILCWFLNLN